MKNKITGSGILVNTIFLIIAAVCVFPVILVISISLTSESGILNNGYTIIPSEWSFEAFNYIMIAKDSILRAYGITVFVTVVGTISSVAVIALYAYPLSRKDFKYRKFLLFFAFFTMLFNGGMVSWYMICTQMLHLKNTILAMILPYLMNAWYVIIMRSFFVSSIPDAIIESAKIDGAGEYRIFFKLILPLSLPGLATIGLFTTLGYWNDWWLPLMYITKPQLRNLQFLLQSMIANIQMLTENSGYISNSTERLANVPKEGARMALCIIAMGPIIIVYPFFQKYFIQGLTVGAIKG